MLVRPVCYATAVVGCELLMEPKVKIVVAVHSGVQGSSESGSLVLGCYADVLISIGGFL